MQFNCQNNHPYKNLIEYINEIEAANLADCKIKLDT
ncbi:hypothetical protein JEODO184_00279 [Jeotgalicoccus meleagridis]|uniref:Uncharacterized protein n=1 Tax=Jeotgalicoccus meleagridis TaxID=2759181 RepID=A0A6V7R374_9STAP|nr:hypothetical protein JEODO184_00279 [Jeotgalicoccus meleagridis]